MSRRNSCHPLQPQPGLQPSRTLDRRSFLQGSVAVAGALVASGGLLGACGSSSPRTTAASPTSTTSPETSGPIVIAQTEDPLSLDPIRLTDYLDITSLVVQSLYTWGPRQTLVPTLASALPHISPDQKTYRIPLRRGISFTNGKPLGADDVVYTLNTILDPSVGSLWAAPLAALAKASAVDAHTVELSLKFPYSPLVYDLADIPIITASVPYGPKVYSRTLLGTGPYRFESWVQGEYIRFSRNPNYWQRGLPTNDGVEFRIISSVASQITALAGGEVDIVPSLPPDLVASVRARKNPVFVGSEPVEQVFVYPSLQVGKPTANRHFRQALSWSVDRAAIIDSVFKGYAVPGAALPSAGELYASPKYESYFGSHADLTRAEAELKSSGGAPSETLSLVVQNLPVLVASAEICQENWAKIGIKTKITQLSIDALYPVLTKGDYDLLLIDTSAGFAPDSAYFALYPTSFTNFNHYNDPVMTQLLDKAVASPNGRPARAAWAAVQKRFVEELPQIILVVARYLEGDSSKMVGYRGSSLGLFLGVERTRLKV
jgi:peptide/nickel transport system substrate-binding protein